MLSQRAIQYLATLHRQTPLATAEVVKSLDAQGIQVFQSWLDFHDEFAGYCEDLGAGDLAVWGLAHESGQWCKPRTADVTPKRDGTPLFIWCADAHPSHDYKLKTDGVFLGPPYRSTTFHIKVERNAVHWHFAASGPVKIAHNGNQVPKEARAELLADMAPFLVAPASDDFARYYLSDDQLLCEGVNPMSMRLFVRP